MACTGTHDASSNVDSCNKHFGKHQQNQQIAPREIILEQFVIHQYFTIQKARKGEFANIIPFSINHDNKRLC